MAEVLDMPVEALERRRERPSERKEKEKPSDEPQIRKRDRDSRERRDDRDDRPHRRGDYHDRLRSPAMAGPPPREREYKRPRPSPSPPPYVPRDRRHSPPRRSPPYKRSRRDEMYDRRGSPRAGFNADDRSGRFGYDNIGAYDRAGMGGRAGYADERSHGRHLPRGPGAFQSGPSDWSGSGRAGFNDGPNMMGVSQREGLMTYKQFITELEDDILPAEAQRRYEEYRTEYITTQKRAFFEAHKDEEWYVRHVRVESKNNYEEQSAATAEWEKKLDLTWQARLHGQDPLEIMSAKEKLEAATTEALDPCVRKIRDEKYGWKYGCGAKGCTKLFHADLITELTAKAREEVYFQNYMNDPDAPGATATTQQSGQRDKARKRKAGPSIAADLAITQIGSGSQAGGPTRARDVDRPDRSSRRENDRNDRPNDEDQYDRNDNSPSRDYQAISGGQDAGRPDSSMFDPFAGPGMRGPPPFGSDMPPPPPVLMPVPGAGPLGPFV